MTIVPSSVGRNFPSSTFTYPRSRIVLTIDAYVEGRPIPCSSSSLMSELSEKRGGGWVKCWFPVSSRRVRTSPSASGGRTFSSAFSPLEPTSPFSSPLSPFPPSPLPSGTAASYTSRKPANFGTEPLARNRYPPAGAPAGSHRMSTAVCSNSAAAICEATNRFHISS